MMKKLNLLILAAFAFAASYTVSAQDVDECMMYMSYYQEYYKQGTKESKQAALPSWRKAYNMCAPGTRQNLYIHGADLYRMLISQNAKNKEYRAELIDTLITLHQLRAQYYPKYADKAYQSLCMDVNNYLKNEPAKAYEILGGVIDKQGAKAGPSAFVAQMNAAVALYKDGKLDAETVINTYDVAMECFSEIQKADTTKITRDLRATVENVFINSRVASCENLQELFAPRFEDSKDDIATVSKIVKLMASADECTDNDLFLKAVTQMHKLEPSAHSAYYLYRLNSKKEPSLAMKYLEEAIASDELDATTKAQYNYELAAFCLKNGNSPKTVDAATKAAADPAYAAKAYMLIGHAWMSVSCSGNEVERRAKYWVAVDYFNKAKAADSELTEDANKLISTCVGYYPESAEAFMYDVQNGQAYTAACGGMRASTTVRTR